MFKGTQLISLLSYPEQFWSLINIRKVTNLKAKYVIFKNSQGAPPSEKLVAGTKYGIENLVTITECVSQILVPEQKLVIPVFVTNFSEGRAPWDF